MKAVVLVVYSTTCFSLDLDVSNIVARPASLVRSNAFAANNLTTAQAPSPLCQLQLPFFVSELLAVFVCREQSSLYLDGGEDWPYKREDAGTQDLTGYRATLLASRQLYTRSAPALRPALPQLFATNLAVATKSRAILHATSTNPS